MMGKWKLVVCGLLFSLFFGVTAMATETSEEGNNEPTQNTPFTNPWDVKEDVEFVSGTATFTQDAYSGGTEDANKIASANTPVDCKFEIVNPNSGVTKVEGDEFASAAYSATLHVFQLKMVGVSVNGTDNTLENVTAQDGSTSLKPTIVVKLKVQGAKFGTSSYFKSSIISAPEEVGNWHIYANNCVQSAAADTVTLFVEGEKGVKIGSRYALVSDVTVKSAPSGGGGGGQPSDDGDSAAPAPASSDAPAPASPPVSFGLESATATVAGGGPVTVSMTDSAQPLSAASIAEAIRAEADKRLSYKQYVKEVSLSVPLTVGQSVELTFDVPEAGPGSKVKVLHFNGAKWEEVPDVAVTGQGKVKVKFTALSPVAILVYDAAKNSPKTSDSDALQYAYAVAALSLLGFAVCRKKSIRK